MGDDGEDGSRGVQAGLTCGLGRTAVRPYGSGWNRSHHLRVEVVVDGSRETEARLRSMDFASVTCLAMMAMM